ncbi:MAG: hypothetical protein JOZ39_09835 [Chloroflexi bacterium]|nr:hypothetical protein [Chloroflexota bacterium]
MIDLLLSPVAAVTVVLALVYALAVHLFLSLGYRKLLWHWLLGMAGMAGGYALAVRAQSNLPTLGDAHVVEGSAVAIAALLIAGLAGRHRGTPENAAR